MIQVQTFTTFLVRSFYCHSGILELPYKGHPPFEDLIARLRSNILGATKLQLTHVQLNEKNWLVYCSKVWDHVKKSSFFVEYAKLLP